MAGACGTVDVNLCAEAERALRITVDDDGPGVDEADRERIFDFLRRGRTRATGTGIGLAVARMILERHGGSIAAGRSALGGARFTIIIPLLKILQVVGFMDVMSIMGKS